MVAIFIKYFGTPLQKEREILDFSANINPLGPPEWFRPLISSQLENLIHYPDPENSYFVEAIAEHTGISTRTYCRRQWNNGTAVCLYAYPSLQTRPYSGAFLCGLYQSCANSRIGG